MTQKSPRPGWSVKENSGSVSVTEISLPKKNVNAFLWLFVNLLFASGLVLLFQFLQIPSLIACIHPFAKTVLYALGITLALDFLSAIYLRQDWFAQMRWSLIVLMTLASLAFWLGSYSHSFLPLSNWHGFLVTEQGRNSERLDSNDVLVVTAGSPVMLTLLTDFPPASCHWTSLHHGDLEDFNNCDNIYSAPAAENDILSIQVIQGCGLSAIHKQIKVSILPP